MINEAKNLPLVYHLCSCDYYYWSTLKVRRCLSLYTGQYATDNIPTKIA